MSYASGTTHYNLPQTVGSDKRDWTDTNQAFSDIDAAIYGAAQGASAATSAIQTINGQIETITAKQAVDEGNISTLSGKVSTLESTVGTQGAAIADVRQDLQDNIESEREASATSTHAYELGDTFYYNDVLYKATAPIAIGGTIVPSTNCTAVTVMSEIDQLSSDLTELGAVRDNTVASNYGDVHISVVGHVCMIDALLSDIPSSGWTNVLSGIPKPKNNLFFATPNSAATGFGCGLIESNGTLSISGMTTQTSAQVSFTYIFENP